MPQAGAFEGAGRRSTALVGACALLACAGTAAAGEAWVFGGELGVTYDSNPGNGATDADRRPTERLAAGVDATYRWRFGRHSALQVRGALDGERDVELEKLSYARGTVRMRTLHKPGDGFHVPVLALWGSLGRREYGSAMRDSDDYRVGAYVAQPVTTALQARLEVTRSRRAAAGRAFDLDERAYALTVDWQTAPGLTVYGELRLGDGGLVISGAGASEIEAKSEHRYLAPVAETIEPDDAFEEADWFAFRVDARTRSAALGGNVPLADGVALDARLQGARAEAAGLAYERWLGSVSLLLRF